MASIVKNEMDRLFADYLASAFQGEREPGIAARLRANEQAQFRYLPNPAWMLLANYDSVSLGLYLACKYGALSSIAVYKVEVLSQTSMVLLFRNAKFVAGQPVESDEQLVAFLQEHKFPIPPCE